MEYYNQHGEKVYYDEFSGNGVRHGGCSNIYLFDDKIIKRYFHYTSKRCRLDYNVFNIFQSIDNPHLMNIYELLIESGNYDITKSIDENFQTITVDAYVATFYERSKIALKDRPGYFLVETLEGLYNLAKLLTLMHMEMDDIKTDNAILTDDTVVLIDPDCYFFNTKEYKELLFTNERQMWRLVKYFVLNEYDNLKKRENVKNRFEYFEMMDNPVLSLSKSLDRDVPLRDILK